MNIWKQACLITFSILMSASGVYAEQMEGLLPGPKVFTKGDLEDYTKDAGDDAKKGAAVLVWEKHPQSFKAEVQIFRASDHTKKLTFLSDSNFFHTMVFFDKDYMWRVRYVDDNSKALSEYSESTPFHIFRRGARDNRDNTIAVQDVESGIRRLPNNKDGIEAVYIDKGERPEVVESRVIMKAPRLPASANVGETSGSSSVEAEIKHSIPRFPKLEDGTPDEPEGFFVEESDGSDEVDFRY